MQEHPKMARDIENIREEIWISGGMLGIDSRTSPVSRRTARLF
jgi:hypothetical protein